MTFEYSEKNLKDYSVWLAGTVVNSIRSSGFETSAPANLAAQQETPVCGFEGIKIDDIDQDMVPKIFSTIFKDCKQDRGGYIEVKKGDFQIEDLDDGNAESGVRSRAKNLIFDFYAPGADTTLVQPQLTFQDTWDFTVSKSEDTGALAYVLTMIGSKPGVQPVKGALSLAGEYAATADSDKNDFDNAVITQASGKLIIDDNAAFSATLENLEFVDSCQASPVGGKMTLGDNTNTLTVEFTDCETVVYSYNGKPAFEQPQ